MLATNLHLHPNHFSLDAIQHLSAHHFHLVSSLLLISLCFSLPSILQLCFSAILLYIAIAIHPVIQPPYHRSFVHHLPLSLLSSHSSLHSSICSWWWLNVCSPSPLPSSSLLYPLCDGQAGGGGGVVGGGIFAIMILVMLCWLVGAFLKSASKFFLFLLVSDKNSLNVFVAKKSYSSLYEIRTQFYKYWLEFV